MIHIVDNLTSTNAWLSKYNSEIDDVVLAIEQAQGRGRRGNTWESQKGGFYASMVSSKHELLPFIVGISIIKVLVLSVPGNRPSYQKLIAQYLHFLDWDEKHQKE